jgi:membrane associated rhomboid family serine protease
MTDVIPSRRTPLVTIGLITVNTLAFVYELQLDGPEMRSLAHTLGVVPSEFSWMRLLTSPFLHDGWIHFGGNMLYLWMFGDNVEDSMGRGPFLLFYLSAAMVAALAYAGLNPSSPVPLIGASGAVTAVIGAYFVLYPRSQILTAVFMIRFLDVIEVPAVFFLAFWVILQAASGLASLDARATSGTAVAAHAAGFAAGGVVGLVFRNRRRWE